MKANEARTATVKILYFARLREAFGRDGESLVLPEGVATVGQLAAFLRQRGAEWETELGSGRAVRVAVNQDMADAGTAIRGGEEIAFFPPVTGG